MHAKSKRRRLFFGAAKQPMTASIHVTVLVHTMRIWTLIEALRNLERKFGEFAMCTQTKAIFTKPNAFLERSLDFLPYLEHLRSYSFWHLTTMD